MQSALIRIRLLVFGSSNVTKCRKKNLKCCRTLLSVDCYLNGYGIAISPALIQNLNNETAYLFNLRPFEWQAPGRSAAYSMFGSWRIITQACSTIERGFTQRPSAGRSSPSARKSSTANARCQKLFRRRAAFRAMLSRISGDCHADA